LYCFCGNIPVSSALERRKAQALLLAGSWLFTEKLRSTWAAVFPQYQWPCYYELAIYA